MAVLSGIKEMVDLCLAVIPNINSIDNLILNNNLFDGVFFLFFIFYNTALHLACQQASLDIVMLIVEDRAKINIANNISLINSSNFQFIYHKWSLLNDIYMTPLHFACIRGDFEIVKFLVSKKVSINSFDSMI